MSIITTRRPSNRISMLTLGQSVRGPSLGGPPSVNRVLDTRWSSLSGIQLRTLGALELTSAAGTSLQMVLMMSTRRLAVLRLLGCQADKREVAGSTPPGPMREDSKPRNHLADGGALSLALLAGGQCRQQCRDTIRRSSEAASAYRAWLGAASRGTRRPPTDASPCRDGRGRCPRVVNGYSVLPPVRLNRRPGKPGLLAPSATPNTSKQTSQRSTRRIAP